MGVLQTPALTTWLRRPMNKGRLDGRPSVARLVPRKGFEPLRPKARPPQDRVSAYSTTSALFFGRSGGTRTPDLRFWRPLLFQLSYTPSRQSSIAIRFGTLEAGRRRRARTLAFGVLVLSLQPLASNFQLPTPTSPSFDASSSRRPVAAPAAPDARARTPSPAARPRRTRRYARTRRRHLRPRRPSARQSR